MEFPVTNIYDDKLLILGTILIVILLFLLLTRQIRSAGRPNLRPLRPLATLKRNIAQATESASHLHVSLGQASLTGAANPTSVAGLTILDHLASAGYANGTPPVTTVGEGTLFLAAQERMAHAFRESGDLQDTLPGMVQYIASDRDPFAYASGVSSTILQNNLAANVLVGRFGSELAIMADAAARKNLDQIIGTDDPTTLALGVTYSDDILIGEELFAVRAYLEGKVDQLAAVRTQDILRFIIAIIILAVAIYQLVTGL